MGNFSKNLILPISFLILTTVLILPDAVPNVKCQTAFPVVETTSPLITFNMTMDSPMPNITYTNVMLLDFQLQINSNLSLGHASLGLSVFYRIDDNSEVHLSSDTYYHKFIDITDLTNGRHKLTILAQMNYIYNDSIVQNKQELPQQIYFSVFNKPPTIQILSPQNSIYFTNNIELRFEIDNPSTYQYQHYSLYWQGYSLDNGHKELENQNDTTLNGLTDGFHSLTFYAQIGNLNSSSTVYFLVLTNPYTEILIILVIIISVLASLLLYRKYRRKIASKQKFC